MAEGFSPSSVGVDRPSAILWDLDGTLVDSEKYWIEQEYALVNRLGNGRWNDEHAAALTGNALLVSGEYLRVHGEIPLSAAEIVDLMLAGVIASVRRHIPWRPGARELLASANRLGVPCALVTMSYRSLASAVVDALPAGTFRVLVTGDDVVHGKPHAEPYLTAAARLGVAPSACVAIEDSLTGVSSAEAAGVPVLAVQHLQVIPPSRGRRVTDSLVGWTVADLATLVPELSSPRPA